MEQMRQNRRNAEKGMLTNKTYNGFFRYNYVRKA